MLYGPHGAPDFFTDRRHRHVLRHRLGGALQFQPTGVRLIGPKPEWARTDGGEAGLHPSNIHDNAYAIGAIDFTGDMPVILGPDGPSLGGFVCPATIVQAELWKMGQLRPGDKVRFKRLTPSEAARLLDVRRRGNSGAQLPAVYDVDHMPSLGADDCIVAITRRRRRAPARRLPPRRATPICWSNTARSCSISRCASAFTR